MKAKIDRKRLLSGIQRVQGVVEKRNTMPILTHILMEAQGGQISFFATDLEVGLQGSFPAEIIEPGRITVSALKLYEMIREFPDGPVHIRDEANHWVVIESGKSHFRMVGLPPEEFPVLPPLDRTDWFEIDPTLFAGLIRRTFFATGDNAPQYVLNGLLVQVEKSAEGKGIIRFIATDGHRLAVAEGEIRGGSAGYEEGIILPKKAILEMSRALDEGETVGAPEISIGENQWVYRWGNTVITSRIIEGEFPNYRQAIPSGNDIHVSMHKDHLEGALRRVSVLAREKTGAIKFSLEDGRILLSANNPEMGEAKEEINASFKGEGFTTGFNARYLLEALSALKGEETTLEFKDALSPCLIKENSEGFLAVIMPMRV
ncbi:MAG: DNA polymerase III subunit beta [Nitrospiria bacterium]